jgi:excisionase family DNA binding protein
MNAPEPLFCTPEEAAASLRIGRTAVYALIQLGELGSVLFGKSRRIPVDELRRFAVRKAMAAGLVAEPAV